MSRKQASPKPPPTVEDVLSALGRYAEASKNASHPDTAAHRTYAKMGELVDLITEVRRTKKVDENRQRIKDLQAEIEAAQKARKDTVPTFFGPVLRDELLEIRSEDCDGLWDFRYTFQYARDEIEGLKSGGVERRKLRWAFRKLNTMALVVIDEEEPTDEADYGQTLAQLVSDLKHFFKHDRRTRALESARRAVRLMERLVKRLPPPNPLEDSPYGW
jgi:hypothetical protein